MSNPDVAAGLIPRFHADGTPWNGALRKCYVHASDATRIGIGDPVKLDTTAAQKDPSGKCPTVIRAASGSEFYGVVVAVELETADSLIYRAASTQRYVFVTVDPDLIYEIQEDSDTSNMTYQAPGWNAELVAGDCNTTTGISTYELDSTSAAVTQAHDMKVIGLVDRADNALGTNAKWLVQFNHHQLADNKIGIGA